MQGTVPSFLYTVRGSLNETAVLLARSHCFGDKSKMGAALPAFWQFTSGCLQQPSVPDGCGCGWLWERLSTSRSFWAICFHLEMASWFRANYFSSLGLGFLNCKMGP